ncbi:glycoside hydrolase family 1 protein [Candidatus Peregrinibacteria bacterium]|nr:glycoside hydrolase family 1 protein [Candidatus Peregrinibacteria bacterium]
MPNFFFGASLSAHQVEGENIHSDWWEFEQNILKPEGKDVSGQATNHWELYETDFHLAHQLGHNAHRLSLEWAKIEPVQGQIDYDVIKHYKKVFESLDKNKLTPIVTLFHFTLPKWFADNGGFENKDNIRHFVNYCKFIGTTFRDELKYIITINEPEIYAYHGYLIKKWPPQKDKYSLFNKVLKNLAKAHNQAYDDLKAIKPDFQVGVAKNNQVFRPDRPTNIFDNLIALFFRKHWNFYFLDLIKHRQDFIGLNYYFYRCVRADIHLIEQFCQVSYPTSRKTDMDWEVYPKGLYLMLKEIYKRYKKPIIITENGVADHLDMLREDVIKEGLDWIFKAKEEGVEVFGYMHWALTDNYEWDSGFDPKFGLIKIDYKDNFVRTIRPSGLLYRDLIKKYQKQLGEK